jgi:CxxC motif-containing protein (DUF1111 family)
MSRIPLERRRKWFGLALFAALLLGLAWHFSPGLPVMFGPSASAATRHAGQELFEHEWQPNDPLAQGDGLGPVFNAKSCVACHNQGGVGGGGGNAHNVLNYQVVARDTGETTASGTIHSAAISPDLQESLDLIRQRNPMTAAVSRNDGHCGYGGTFIPAFDPVRTDSVQATALFGSGWVDRISSKAILSNSRSNLYSGMVREMNLDFSKIPSGRPRMLSGGRVGKFGWKAQFATLEEFVAAACANELGLGTPKSEQARPINKPNYADVEPDLNRKQFRALVAFVDTLPRPIEGVSESLVERQAAERGRQLFTEVGCAVCHVPDMGGVKAVYSDFLLHRLNDPTPGGGDPYGGPPRPDRPLNSDQPDPDEWKTPALWGVADSAPYMHDGKAETLEAAILRHGGDARTVRDAYHNLNASDQSCLVMFLKTLKAPPDAIPTSIK